MDRRRLLIIVAVGWIFVIYMMMTAPKPDQAEAKGKADKSGAQENSDSELEKGGDQDADVPAENPQSKKNSEAVTDPAAALDSENEAGWLLCCQRLQEIDRDYRLPRNLD